MIIFFYIGYLFPGIQDLNLTSFFKVASTDCRSEEREYTTFTKVAMCVPTDFFMFV